MILRSVGQRGYVLRDITKASPATVAGPGDMAPTASTVSAPGSLRSQSAFLPRHSTRYRRPKQRGKRMSTRDAVEVPQETITLADSELELVRREMLKSAARDLEAAAAQLQDLAIVSPWPAGCRSDDAQGAVSLARESLDLLDHLGWPEGAS